MGIVQTIDFDSFPAQRETIGKKTNVYFKYDTSRVLTGTIIRDDLDYPFTTIIGLEDGRLILGTECQYTFPVE